MKKHLFWVCATLFCLTSASFAQTEPSPFLLNFNGDLHSTEGEPPVRAVEVKFDEGIAQQGASLNQSSRLDYRSADKISLTQGTIEFWIKPQWNSDDNLDHVFFALDSNILFYKDEGNFINCYLRYDKQRWFSIAYFFAQHWRAEEWHHLAITWQLPGKVLLYVDGFVARYRNTTIPSLYAQLPPTLSIGHWAENYPAQAMLDHLRVYQRERSAQEIAMSFSSVLQVASLMPQTDLIEMFRDWNITTTLLAETQIGVVKLPLAALNAVSYDPEAVAIREGRLLAIAPGSATIRVFSNSVSTHFTAQVRAPAREPDFETPPDFLQQPASGCLYTIPVVMIKYLPTRDGVMVDSQESNYVGTLESLNAKVTEDAIRTKFILEEGSRFHGYRDPSAQPAIGYRVVASLTIYESAPPGFPTITPGVYFTDYNLILNRIGAKHFVTTLGVKEFWLWTHHNGVLAPTESNMSSPLTGDVSNSYRITDDMPVYDRSYTLYNYNFTRGSNEDVHNHGHQLEALLSYVNFQQDGNYDLFWKKFVGRDDDFNFITGRCGWTHMPPNTTDHYDYANPTLKPSDIESWTPEGLGHRTLVSAATWRNQDYRWPAGTRPDEVTQPHWYIYWMQNMPGRDNPIPYLNTQMTNWWAFTGDWDGSIRSGLGLYGVPTGTPHGSNAVVMRRDFHQRAIAAFDGLKTVYGNACAASPVSP